MEARLALLGQFLLTVDDRIVAVDKTSVRILAAFAIYERMERGRLAGLLWPDACRDRGLANLRAGLWRMPSPARQLITTNCSQLDLRPEVEIDLDSLSYRRRAASSESEPRPSSFDVDHLTAPLLAGWYDEWVIDERYRIRTAQMEWLRRRVLDHLQTGDAAAAVIDATWAITVDPLDESAHQLLLRSHLAEGNVGEAVNHYEYMRRLFDLELGIAPFPETWQIIEPCLVR